MTKQLIDRDEVIKILETKNTNENEIIKRIESLPIESQWIDVKDRKPEEKNLNRILAYDEWTRNSIITATFYNWKWLRDDNENICFFDLWQPLLTPPITNN